MTRVRNVSFTHIRATLCQHYVYSTAVPVLSLVPDSSSRKKGAVMGAAPWKPCRRAAPCALDQGWAFDATRTCGEAGPSVRPRLSSSSTAATALVLWQCHTPDPEAHATRWQRITRSTGNTATDTLKLAGRIASAISGLSIRGPPPGLRAKLHVALKLSHSRCLPEILLDPEIKKG